MAWLSGYEYRAEIPVDSTGGAQTDYQKKIIINYGSGSNSAPNIYCDSKCETDFDDIRFTKADGTTEIDYWIQSKVDSDNAVIWVELPTTPAASTTTYYVYYGKSGDTTTSNGANTFFLFDDFPGSSLDGKWTIVQGSSATVSGGKVRLNGTEIRAACNIEEAAWTCRAKKVSVPSSSFMTTVKKLAAYPNWSYWAPLLQVDGDVWIYDYSGSQYFLEHGTDITDSNYHIYETSRNSSSLWTLNIDGGTAVSATDSTSTDFDYITLWGDGSDTDFDWYHVRKYTDPEPAWDTFGSEEAGATILTDTVTLSDLLSKTITKTLSETITLSDNVNKDITAVRVEDLTLSDALVKGTVFTKTLIETLKVRDADELFESFEEATPTGWTQDEEGMRQARSSDWATIGTYAWRSEEPEGFAPPAAPTITVGTAITDIQDLQDMNNDLSGTYYLANNIDASATVTWNGGAGFDPIGGNFTGTLEGNGYNIDGLIISRPSTDYIGVIARAIGASISNVGVTDANIVGRQFVGALVGEGDGGTVISACFSTGTMEATFPVGSGSASVGGLVGGYDLASMYDSFSRATVIGEKVIGGLFGSGSGEEPYEFRRCYAAGLVTATVGGIYVGGFTGGYEWDPFEPFYGCFWDKEATTQDASRTLTAPGVSGISTAQMKTQSTFTDADWDFTNTWGMNAAVNDGYPYLRAFYGPGVGITTVDAYSTMTKTFGDIGAPTLIFDLNMDANCGDDIRCTVLVNSVDKFNTGTGAAGISRIWSNHAIPLSPGDQEIVLKTEAIAQSTIEWASYWDNLRWGYLAGVSKHTTLTKTEIVTLTDIRLGTIQLDLSETINLSDVIVGINDLPITSGVASIKVVVDRG